MTDPNNPPAITPDDLLIYNAEYLSKAYLNLHEENASLRTQLEIEYTNVENLIADVERSHKEIVRLREQLEHQRKVNQNILKDFSEAMAEWRKEIEKNALKEPKE